MADAHTTPTVDAQGAHAEHGPDHAGDLARLPTLETGGVRNLSLAALAVGGIAFVVLSFLAVSQSGGDGVRDIFMGYAAGFVFWFSLPFGAAALLLISYLTSASWGIVLRRCFQASTRTFPLVTFVLFSPVVAGLYFQGGTHSNYWWADHELREKSAEELRDERGGRVEAMEETKEKVHAFLNPVAFVVSSSVIFSVMGLVMFALNAWGRKAEAVDDTRSLEKLKAISGPGTILWTLSMTVISTSWVMSVEPIWASSMFPIVYGMNMLLTAFAFSILVFYSGNTNKADVLGIVKDKFRIDMGSLLLAFTMVWAYASFCQYMLIWAGNLPEELIFYRKRGDHGWEYLAYFLMAFHWLVPFMVLLFREVKTNPRYMQLLCTMLLVVCVADVIWWMVPAVEHPSGVLHVPLALAAVAMIGGAWGVLFARELGRLPTLPANREGRFLATWGHHH